jgi:serralysin
LQWVHGMPNSWSNTQIVDNLLRGGASWSGSTITFGFPAEAPNWSFSTGEGSGFSGLSAAQQTMARLAVSLWDDLITPDFAETSSAPSITFQNSSTGVGFAHAYFPGNWGGAGSVWFNPDYDATSGTNDLVTPKIGQWGALTYIHELGHALGLEHPGEYNGGNPTYDNDALYAQDSIMYSVMSYFDGSETGADWVAANGKTYYAQTPMLHDILAIQALYGAEMSTRSGDTVYGFNSNTGSVIFDFSQNLHPILTIWDGSGVDWLDLSGFATASRIDLNQGAFSDCDGMTKNIAIAYNCNIENAAGGSGNDRITGNALDNTLMGNAGNDVLTGAAGADILIGGDGNDTFYADAFDYLLQFSGGLGYDILYYSGSPTYSYDFASYGFEEMWFTNELVTPATPGVLTGTDAAETLAGSEANESIYGLGGNDTLNGNGGDDTLSGGPGNDRLDGGAGNDTADYAGATAGVTVSLSLTSQQNTIGAGYDTLSLIENLSGSALGDTLTGSATANLLMGLDGNDVLDGRAGADTLVGGHGNDSYTVDSLGDVVNETDSDGNDTVLSSVTFSLADTASTRGALENLTLTGSGNVNATGNSLANVIAGNSRSNVLDGGDGVDTITYAAAGAAVTVNLSLLTSQNTGSGSGLDTLLNFENLMGSRYADRLTGSTTGNVLAGLAGNDVIAGNAGADTLVGGAGRDTLTGGADADIFVYQAVTDSAGSRGRDLITDLVVGVDRIDLSAIDAATGGSDDAFAFLGSAAFSGVAGQLRAFVSNGQTIIAGDINGDSVADIQIALTGAHALTASEFIL